MDTIDEQERILRAHYSRMKRMFEEHFFKPYGETREGEDCLVLRSDIVLSEELTSSSLAKDIRKLCESRCDYKSILTDVPFCIQTQQEIRGWRSLMKHTWLSFLLDLHVRVRGLEKKAKVPTTQDSIREETESVFGDRLRRIYLGLCTEYTSDVLKTEEFFHLQQSIPASHVSRMKTCVKKMKRMIQDAEAWRGRLEACVKDMETTIESLKLPPVTQVEYDEE